MDRIYRTVLAGGISAFLNRLANNPHSTAASRYYMGKVNSVAAKKLTDVILNWLKK